MRRHDQDLALSAGQLSNGSIPVVVNECVPLERDCPITGRRIEVLCMRLGRELHFHPDRLSLLKSEIAWRSSAHLARWADDGGREP